MEYRKLGRSGLEVSRVAYGDMLAEDNEENQKRTNETINKCFELGINYFDTAEAYGGGQHETLLGRALKQCGRKREDYVVSTKMFFGNKNDPNGVGLSRKHIIEGVNASLKRLQLDYVDIVFCHRPDFDAPIEEICATFAQLIKEGKTFYWATSMWPPELIIDAMGVCDKYGYPAPIAEQCKYHMLARRYMEKDYTYLFDKFGYGTTTYSPVARGLLTRKFIDNPDPTGTCFASDNPTRVKYFHFMEWFSPEKYESTKKKWAQLEKIAEELGAGSLSVLAMAWVLKNSDVSTMIAGMSKPQYVEDAVKAVGISKKITKEIEEQIDAILENRIERGLNAKTWKPVPPRRLEEYASK